MHGIWLTVQEILFYEYGSEEDIVDAREALVQNDDKKNDSKKISGKL